MNQTHDLSPGLLRQRRNLVVASATLLFLAFAQAELHSFQLLGLNATFGRPEAVIISLLAVTFYFIYRYWLYILQEQSSGLRSEFYKRLNRYAKPKVKALRDAEYPAGKGLQIEEDLGVRGSEKYTWVIKVGSARDGQGGYKCNDLKVPYSAVWWESIKALFMAVVARSYFTDYVFPFLLAGAAIFITVCDNWF